MIYVSNINGSANICCKISSRRYRYTTVVTDALCSKIELQRLSKVVKIVKGAACGARRVHGDDDTVQTFGK